MQESHLFELPDDFGLVPTSESEPPQYSFDNQKLYIIVDNNGDDDVKLVDLTNAAL
jgi:hypothetical protein